MWDCLKCGCLAIAHDLGFCPKCFTPKEGDMPKGTTGGSSNASAEPFESGYIALEEQPETDPDPETETPDEPEKAPESEPAAPAAPAAPSSAPKSEKAAEPATVTGTGGVTLKPPGASNG
jgi:hypothetical protein